MVCTEITHRPSSRLPSSLSGRLEGNQNELPRMDSGFAMAAQPMLDCLAGRKSKSSRRCLTFLPLPLSQLCLVFPLAKPNKVDTGPPPRVDTIRRRKRMSPYNKDDSDNIYKVHSGSGLKGYMNLKKKKHY